MNRNQIANITGNEISHLISENEALPEVQIFRRPDPRDETDRIGREIVQRMMEAGVVES